MGMLNAEITKLPFLLPDSLFQYHCSDFALECVTSLKELTVCFRGFFRLFGFLFFFFGVGMMIWFLFFFFFFVVSVGFWWFGVDLFFSLVLFFFIGTEI